MENFHIAPHIHDMNLYHDVAPNIYRQVAT